MSAESPTKRGGTAIAFRCRPYEDEVIAGSHLFPEFIRQHGRRQQMVIR
jgi:hypothetical protein